MRIFTFIKFVLTVIFIVLFFDCVYLLFCTEAWDIFQKSFLVMTGSSAAFLAGVIIVNHKADNNA